MSSASYGRSPRRGGAAGAACRSQGRALRRPRTERVRQSTLLRIAAGFDRPSAGVARTLGVDLGARLVARGGLPAQHLGLLDQHYARALSPLLRALRTSRCRCARGRLTGGERGDAHSRCSRRGPRGPRRRRPAALGRRAAARGRCARSRTAPALLLADEPAGDSTRARRHGLRLLAELAARSGTTLVIVSHDAPPASWPTASCTCATAASAPRRRPRRPLRLVVARGGWVRLPESARDGAGIGARAELAGGERRGRHSPATAWLARRSPSRRARPPRAARSCASSAASTRATGREPARIAYWPDSAPCSPAAGWSPSRAVPAPARPRCCT